MVSGSQGWGVLALARSRFRCLPVKPKIAAEGQGKVLPRYRCWDGPGSGNVGA